MNADDEKKIKIWAACLNPEPACDSSYALGLARGREEMREEAARVCEEANSVGTNPHYHPNIIRAIK